MENQPPKPTSSPDPSSPAMSSSSPPKSVAEQPTTAGDVGPTQSDPQSAADIPTQSPEDAATQGGATKTLGELSTKAAAPKEHKLTQLGEYRLIKALGAGGM